MCSSKAVIPSNLLTTASAMSFMHIRCQAIKPNCDFFITKDSCFLRGATRVGFGAHQSFIKRMISETLQSCNYSKVDFYIDKDLLNARVGFGLLASPTLDDTELNTATVTEMIST